MSTQLHTFTSSETHKQIPAMTAKEMLLSTGWNRNANHVSDMITGESFPETFVQSWVGVYVRSHAWGFEVIKFHGMLCPYTSVKFPMYTTEHGLGSAYERMAAFLEKNEKRGEALPAYLWGD